MARKRDLSDIMIDLVKIGSIILIGILIATLILRANS